MARTKKAAEPKNRKARKAPEAKEAQPAEEAEQAEEAEDAPEAPEAEGVAVAPPKKGKKNKEAARKDDDQPSPKKRRSSKEEGAVEEDGDEPAAEVAKLTTSSEKSDSPLLVFAHGAGAPSSHEWMVRWKGLLGEALGAVEVVTFDYPYCANGKKNPSPKAEKLVNFHKEEIKKAMSRHPGHPLVLAGKSMGSRVSCMVAGQEDLEVAAVVCLGYPLKVASGGLRDQTLLELKAPVLLVQGSKDAMSPSAELEKVCKKMTVPCEVHVVTDGDHSLKISKKVKVTQEESDQKVLNHIKRFLAKVLTNSL